MPEPRQIVINTGPLIALVAAQGNLELLRCLYAPAIVPYEVCEEVLTGSATKFGATEFSAATWLDKRTAPTPLNAFLRNALDRGEAAVIQLALTEGIETVCIDEPVGRRVARLHGLKLTGSLGVLLRAKREGHGISMRAAIARMQRRGIRLGERVAIAALRQAGES